MPIAQEQTRGFEGQCLGWGVGVGELSCGKELSRCHESCTLSRSLLVADAVSGVGRGPAFSSVWRGEF